MSCASNEDVSRGPLSNGIERVAPYAYWRTLGSAQYDLVHHLQLSCMLGSVLAPDRLWRRALGGDPAASVAIAMTTRIPTVITYPTDLRMSVLLGGALGGDAACALVMSHMLLRMPIERELKVRLSESWSSGHARIQSSVFDPNDLVGGDR